MECGMQERISRVLFLCVKYIDDTIWRWGGRYNCSLLGGHAGAVRYAGERKQLVVLVWIEEVVVARFEPEW